MFRNFILGVLLLCFNVSLYAQKNNIEIIYNHKKISADSSNYVSENPINIELVLKYSKLKITYKNDSLLVNNNKVYCFSNVEFYEHFVHLRKNKKECIYIYPQYKNYYTPYTHIGLGIVVEINNKKIIIKENINSFDDTEINEALTFKKFKIRKDKDKKCANAPID